MMKQTEPGEKVIEQLWGFFNEQAEFPNIDQISTLRKFAQTGRYDIETASEAIEAIGDALCHFAQNCNKTSQEIAECCFPLMDVSAAFFKSMFDPQHAPGRANKSVKQLLAFANIESCVHFVARQFAEDPDTASKDHIYRTVEYLRSATPSLSANGIEVLLTAAGVEVDDIRRIMGASSLATSLQREIAVERSEADQQTSINTLVTNFESFAKVIGAHQGNARLQQDTTQIAFLQYAPQLQVLAVSLLSQGSSEVNRTLHKLFSSYNKLMDAISELD